MKGHYNDILEDKIGIYREVNASLALVTPCYLLDEILNSEAAKVERKQINSGLEIISHFRSSCKLRLGSSLKKELESLTTTQIIF